MFSCKNDATDESNNRLNTSNIAYEITATTNKKTDSDAFQFRSHNWQNQVEKNSQAQFRSYANAIEI